LKPHLQAMNGNPSLAQRYQAVKARIERAAVAAGRDPGSVRLLAVGKTFPAAGVAELAALGQDAFGENYLQEALAKMAALAHLRPGWPVGERADLPPGWPVAADSDPDPDHGRPGGRPAIEWHFIGPIQSNKTRKIAESFDWVQSVDQERIARRLSEQRPSELPPLQVCLQVNVSGEASKSGCAPEEVVPLALAIAALPGIRLRGLMAIPEPTDDADLQASRFAHLRGLLDEVRQALEKSGLPGADRLDTLSMGMSADLETAIAAGATIVRVGSSLFGERQVRG
jgi:pyridoxal phosphate enzyme (YggS family)